MITFTFESRINKTLLGQPNIWSIISLIITVGFYVTMWLLSQIGLPLRRFAPEYTHSGPRWKKKRNKLLQSFCCFSDNLWPEKGKKIIYTCSSHSELTTVPGFRAVMSFQLICRDFTYLQSFELIIYFPDMTRCDKNLYITVCVIVIIHLQWTLNFSFHAHTSEPFVFTVNHTWNVTFFMRSSNKECPT